MATEYHRIAHEVHGGAFGSGDFGKFGETIARFFGTPQYLIGQTLVVVVWIVFNGYELLVHFDPYPFILLNLGFSLQAAYAAPLILLAQTRQAARDKAFSDADAQHREEITAKQTALLVENTHLTEEIHRLTLAVHELVSQNRAPS
ncbi:MAG TPA: DUF1003 domain-containing protein [Dehalococcoidia bacterium]|jgi:uncharacterized membrane protein